MTSKYRKYTKLLFAHTSHFTDILHNVRMAEWSKALRSGRSPLLWAWVRIPLLTKVFLRMFFLRKSIFGFINPVERPTQIFFLVDVVKV